MKRQIPYEVGKVREWCIRKNKFEDANFITTIRQCMENNQRIMPGQASRLANILRMYTLDVDLIRMIRERMIWRKK